MVILSLINAIAAFFIFTAIVTGALYIFGGHNND